jgi:hypothetical protein
MEGGQAVSEKPKPTCPFCGAAPKKNWTEKVLWFNCGTMVVAKHTRHDQTTQCVEAEVARLTKKRDELQRWKDEQLAVEAQWDPQAVARVLGLPLGVSVRAEILPGIRKLAAERDEARNFARKMRSKAHTSEPYPWLKTGAKEAKP